MNVSSASSAASSLWNLLASRAAASSKSGSTASTASTASTGSSTDASYSATATCSEDVATTANRPPGPPPSPGQFDVAMSTAQFAGMGPMGPPPTGGEDPMASLDTDANGSVSADEFGLEGASDDVKALFNGIDSDGSGDLSTEELSSFKDQMTEAMQQAGGPPPGSPPMGGSASDAGDDSDEDSSDETTTAAAAASQPKLDVNSFLQQIAARYASLGAESATSEAGLSMMA